MDYLTFAEVSAYKAEVRELILEQDNLGQSQYIQMRRFGATFAQDEIKTRLSEIVARLLFIKTEVDSRSFRVYD